MDEAEQMSDEEEAEKHRETSPVYAANKRVRALIAHFI